MMTTTKKTTALAVVDSFQLVDRYEGIDPELMAELQDELSDLDPESGITCRQIKVPSGGGIAYEVQGEEEGDAEPMNGSCWSPPPLHRCETGGTGQRPRWRR